jgi:hypothetical protein
VRATVLGRADHSCDSQVDAGAIGCHAGTETAVGRGAPADLDARFEQAARRCESVEASGCHAGTETAVGRGAPADLDARFEQAARHCESVEAGGCHAGTEGGEGGDARAIILEASGRHAGVGVQALVPGTPEVGKGDNAGAWVLESVTQAACNQSVTLATVGGAAPQPEDDMICMV